MNGELLMAGASSLIERLLLASVDVVLLGSLVWGFLWLFRRCPPRLAALLWLLVLAKPLVTLTLGPSASLFAIPLPWDIGNVPSASATNLTSEPEPAEARRPEVQSLPIERPADVAPSVIAEYAIEMPAHPDTIPTMADPQ